MPETHANLFLNALSEESRSALLKHCVEVDLPLRKALYDPNQVPRYAYFPLSGVASVVTGMADGGTAEVGLIGREGLIGSLHVLGPANVATSCFIQLKATGLRMPFPELWQAFHNNPEIRDLTLEFVQEQAVTLGQIAGCNRLHDNEERLARCCLPPRT